MDYYYDTGALSVFKAWKL